MSAGHALPPVSLRCTVTEKIKIPHITGRSWNTSGVFLQCTSFIEHAKKCEYDFLLEMGKLLFYLGGSGYYTIPSIFPTLFIANPGIKARGQCTR